MVLRESADKKNSSLNASGRRRSNSLNSSVDAKFLKPLSPLLRSSPRSAGNRTQPDSPTRAPKGNGSLSSSSLSNTSGNTTDVDVSLVSQKSSDSKKKGTKLKACPCNNSSDGKEWLVACPSCKQSWHTSCGNLKGALKLTQGYVDVIVNEWLCPWCYVCPFERPKKHPSAKNEQVLMEASISSAITQRLTESITELVERAIPKIDTSSIKTGLEELSSCINGIKAQIRQPNAGPPDTNLQTSAYQPAAKMHPAVKPEELTCPEPPYTEHIQNFLEVSEMEAVEATLNQLRDSKKFVEENGHSVFLFGHPYTYNGSKTPDKPEAMPPVLKSVAEKLQARLRLETPLNSVLINHYTTSASHLAKHSDNESVILADSQIVTLSVGGSRTIHFEHIHSKEENQLPPLEVENNSVYSMTRSSQAWYRHEVPCDSHENTERFSLTFRSVSDKFSRSLIIQGDSNTKDINFGEGSGRVGSSYPGKRIKAAKVDDINVNACVGYSNVFICCGTNNLRCEYIKSEVDIHRTVDMLESKLRSIKQLCPQAKIFVSPVLPSRIPSMNRHIMKFNDLVDVMLLRFFPDICFKDISSFLDNQGLLSTKLTRPGDKIHLNSRGIAKFVSHIKSCIYSKEIFCKYGDRHSPVNEWDHKFRQESAPTYMGPPWDP